MNSLNNDKYIIKIAKIIGKIASQENDDLNEISGYGIFHMPELAFAYTCGKHIMSSAIDIFGDLNPVWKREIDLGNGGPTDLLIELDGSKDIAIEFKLRDTADSYISDLSKLNRLDNDSYVKVFCALIDTFTSDLHNDGRIKKIESFQHANIASVLEPKPNFTVKQDWYKKDVSCVIGIWTVE